MSTEKRPAEHPEPIERRDLVEHPLWADASDGLVLVERDGRIVATNPALAKMFGYAEAWLLGRSLEILLPASSRAAHVRHRADFEADGEPRPMTARRQLQGQRADGTTFPINASLGQLMIDGRRLSYAAVRDLTKRVEAEAEAATARQLRLLAEDRERIAYDLHDTVIQRLFALGLGLQGLPDQVADDAIAHRLRQAVDTLDSIIHEIRTSIFDLDRFETPATRAREGARAIVADAGDALGFEPVLRIEGPIDAIAEPLVVHHLLAVLREGVSNAVRHADASHIAVLVEVTDDTVSVTITDDGTGIDPDRVGSGIANMRERAASLGGRLEVTDNDPVGTLVRWRAPITLHAD